MTKTAKNPATEQMAGHFDALLAALIEVERRAEELSRPHPDACRCRLCVAGEQMTGDVAAVGRVCRILCSQLAGY